MQPALGNRRVRAWMEGSGHKAMMDTSCERRDMGAYIFHV
jgi:hypothetical protein